MVMHELLTNAQMAKADRLAVKLGVPSLTLMENAGCAVADEAVKMVDANARIVVLCGPGNNGGDGFVAARLLKERGYEVRVFCLVALDALDGDAAANAKRWIGKGGRIEEMGRSHGAIGAAALVIDALFGAGLARGIEGEAAAAIARANASRGALLAVDVPSGLSGDTGAPVGDVVVAADRTVTFFRRKPGHVLFPGRDLCGEVVVADIGIPSDVLRVTEGGDLDGKQDAVAWRAQANHIGGLVDHLKRGGAESHKYDHGHAVVVSGPGQKTGAARLAARAALRIGAGLVTVASPHDAVAINAAQLTAVMVEPFEAADGLASILSDRRKNAVAIGPGCGVCEGTAALLRVVLGGDAACVLDADALSVLANEPDSMWPLLRARRDVGRPVVLTPHEGEFARLFAKIARDGGSKLERARAAAEESSAVVVLKGADTVIAAPDGHAAINENAPPWLATAGSGDVLAGFITGLMAQGMDAFEAARAAVWTHGACANRFGPGLIAEDLPELVPNVLRDLYRQAAEAERMSGRRRAATVAREGGDSRAGEPGES